MCNNGFGFGGSSCSWVIILLIIWAVCGGGWGGGCGDGCGNNNGCGC